jgi:hypothetical protein
MGLPSNRTSRSLALRVCNIEASAVYLGVVIRRPVTVRPSG